MSDQQTIIVKEWRRPKTRWEEINEHINWLTLAVAIVFGCPLAVILSSYGVIK